MWKRFRWHGFLLAACLLLMTACAQAATTSAPTLAAPSPAATIIPTNTVSSPATMPPADPTLRLTETPAQPAPPSAEKTALDEINGDKAREFLEDFIAETGPRLPGSEAEAEAAEIIQAEFEAMGYTVEVQPFPFYNEDEENELDSANLIAVKPGASPREIVVGAHYDSVDEADGVDDNASGVAVLLEVAAKVQEADPPYTIRFVAFGAEENDLDGSRYYVSQMSTTEVKNTLGMINLDSLAAGDIAYVYGDMGTPESLRDWILNNAVGLGFALEAKTARDMDNEDGSACECADYGPFEQAGIPFAYFESTNWNQGKKDGMTQVDPQFGDAGEIRHTEYDTVEYIDQAFPGRIDRHFNLYVTLLYNVLTQYQ